MDEEFYIAESLKVDKEGILFLADLWEKIESFSGGKVLLHFDEVKDIDANLSAALGPATTSITTRHSRTTATPRRHSSTDCLRQPLPLPMPTTRTV